MNTKTDDVSGAVAAPVERPVVRPAPECANADALICPWCGEQIWNHCQSQYDTMTCVWRPLEGDDA